MKYFSTLLLFVLLATSGTLFGQSQTKTEALSAPVVGPMNDTLLVVRSNLGVYTPSERALTIRKRLDRLYDGDGFKPEALTILAGENTYDVVYQDLPLVSVTSRDAELAGVDQAELATLYLERIKNSVETTRTQRNIWVILSRIGLVLLVIGMAWLVIWLIDKGYKRLYLFMDQHKEKWLKDLSFKDYTFLTADQEMGVVLFLVRTSRWVIYAVLLYITLPVMFSIFPFSRGWADTLFNLIWSPFKGMLLGFWAYLPKLFTILVIYFVFKYVIRFVHYIFSEIESGKLRISGFHSDWAMPTNSIVKFLLYAFAIVLIFPNLPGSDSAIFKGVSVFVGLLVSLGSSSAISNVVAGLVITYMRPFTLGDRITIGSVTGDVVEKTLLVTRIRTIYNELVTIPNAAVLSGNTTNFSSEAQERGYIVHTTVSIGYDAPWKDVHAALIEAAGRTTGMLTEPAPFVLQSSLDDFYVSYQLNGYTQSPSRQALLRSELHQHIQDVCNERGIEIMSPHYRAARDGNTTTIPSDYVPKGYKAPGFKVTITKENS